MRVAGIKVNGIGIRVARMLEQRNHVFIDMQPATC